MPDTIKTLPPVKLDEKTQFIGVVAYFSDDQPLNGNKSRRWKEPATITACWCMYVKAASK